MSHPWVPEVASPKTRRIALTRTAEPDDLLSLEDLKTHLRITSDDEDTAILLYLRAATDVAERLTGRSFVTQKWRLAVDEGIPGDILDLPRPPLISVETVKTYALDGTESTFSSSNYVVDAERSRIFLKTDVIWPSPLRDERSIVVDYTSGYGADPGDVPAGIRLAVLRLTGEHYENREFGGGKVGGVVLSTLRPYFWRVL